LHSSKKTDWGTPPELFERWNRQYGPFDLDPCTSPDNPLGTPHFYTKEDDGLKQPWFGRVYCNPPYGRDIGDWLTKAINETADGNAKLVVMLLPARTGPKWFHKYVLPCAWRIVFLQGRITFVGAEHPAPFDSMLAIFKTTKHINRKGLINF
jgi:site-specific DNA-methyltransferase (adenine-specific)